MENPFSSEANAFRLVVALLAVGTAVAVASLLGGRRAGLAVLVGIGLVALVVFLIRRRRDGSRATPTS